MRYSELRESIDSYNLKAKYAKFNTAYFNGQLPDIPLRFANLKGVGGVANAKIIRTGPKSKYRSNVELVPGSVEIVLSSKFRRTEEELDAVLLHEMIHVYFYFAGQFEEDHGIAFNRMRRTISQLSGIEVPLTETFTDLELNVPVAVKAIGVLLIYKSDGSHSFMIISEKDANVKKEALENTWGRRIGYGVKAVSLYIVATPIWTLASQKFPIQRAMKSLYKLADKHAYQDLIANGRLLFSIGNL